MKRFKTISTSFIIVIAVIFGCNVYYLVSLYNSIRDTMEKDVMSALFDADLDELWIRAESANGKRSALMTANVDEEAGRRHGEISATKDSSGNVVSTTRYADGTIVSKSLEMEGSNTFNNFLAQSIGRQMHNVIDPYVAVDIAIMDSVLEKRLNDRRIYPDYVAVEITDSNGGVIIANPRHKDGSYDVFTYRFNPDADEMYRMYITPLTRHIFFEMAGVIITIMLLMVAFSLAFWYLIRTVSRLRTIEEMKDDFVSNMTHELKTPIAIAYSANDALLHYDTANDPAKKEKYLTIANKQLKRLGELVENILAMSMERRKAMKLKPEEIQLQPFMEEIATAQRMRGGKEITINVSVDEAAIVEADATHFANVLNNLIDNAIKYSGESVTVTISGDGREISVADNGIGIPAKSLPYLFNKFYRVPHGNRQDVRGYGIGLYYVKSIVDRMGWTVAVRSKEGEGSVFTIIFGKDER